MENNLMVFENVEFGKVRTVVKDEVIWFIAKDVSEILGYSDTNAMTRRLDKDELESYTDNSSGQVRNVNIINESGLYNSIIGSKKPEAKAFKKWVTSEVLPSIRKTGGYIIEKEEDTPEEIMARALLVAQETLKRREERIKNLECKIVEDAPKVSFADKLLKSKDSILVRDYAKILYDEKINIGEKRLYKWLRENKYLMQDNMPYQQYMKHFAIKESSIDTPFGVKITKTTLVTPEGQLYFYEKLKNHLTK